MSTKTDSLTPPRAGDARRLPPFVILLLLWLGLLTGLLAPGSAGAALLAFALILAGTVALARSPHWTRPQKSTAVALTVLVPAVAMFVWNVSSYTGDALLAVFQTVRFASALAGTVWLWRVRRVS